MTKNILLALVASVPLFVAGHLPDAIYVALCALYIRALPKGEVFLYKENFVSKVLIPAVGIGLGFALVNAILNFVGGI